jgi:PEP-CTERM/exosortase A-associated glycosyltransferase
MQRGYCIRGYYITKFQKKDGLTPYVLTSPRQYEGNTEATHDAIRYFRTKVDNGFLSRIPVVRELIQIVKVKNRICDIARVEHFDWLHAHSPVLWGISAAWAGKILKKKVIYEIRAFWEDAAVDAGKYKENSVLYKITRWLETIIVKKVYKVVVICEGLRKDLIERGIPGDKIVVVPNSVDTDSFLPIEKNKGLIEKHDLDGKIVCGFIGSMFNFEGLELLVEAIKQNKLQQGNLRVVLVGEGEKYNDIKEMVKLAKLEQTIRVLGKVPHDQIKKYYSIIDIFVYPRISKRITELVTPLKPLEAMAMAKTVVASDVGGLKELVQDGENGFLFKAGSVDDLAEKVSALITRPETIVSTGIKARQLIEKNRKWEDLIKIYEHQVYIEN